MRQPRLALAAAAALVAVGALGAGPAGGAEGSSNPYEITASGKAFNPNVLAVKPGTEVTWTVVEADGTSHSVEFEGINECSGDRDCEKENRSEWLSNGVSFQRTFDEVGEFRYYCIRDQYDGMRGVVYVNETGTPPSTAPPPPPPTTAPPTTQPPTTSPPATAPPTTAPRPTSPPPTAPRPAPTTTTKPPKAGAAGKVKPPKPPKTTTTKPGADSTTTTVPPMVLPPLAERGPLVQVPAADSTTTTLLPGKESGDDGFVAINKGSRRGGVKKMTYAAVGALGLSLLGGGVIWWRRRPSRYWTA